MTQNWNGAHGETRRLEPNPKIIDFHARTSAAIAALEAASRDEEREQCRAAVEALRDEAIERIRATQAAFWAARDGAR